HLDAARPHTLYNLGVVERAQLRDGLRIHGSGLQRARFDETRGKMREMPKSEHRGEDEDNRQGRNRPVINVVSDDRKNFSHRSTKLFAKSVAHRIGAFMGRITKTPARGSRRRISPAHPEFSA